MVPNLIVGDCVVPANFVRSDECDNPLLENREHYATLYNTHFKHPKLGIWKKPKELIGSD
jgi:hypothetical protein